EQCKIGKREGNSGAGCHLLLESPAGIHISSTAFARYAENSQRKPRLCTGEGAAGYWVGPRWRGVAAAGDAPREDAGARVCAVVASRATTSRMEKGKSSLAWGACARSWTR